MKNKIIILLVVSWLVNLHADLVQLKPIELAGKVGGYANGNSWKSDSLIGKTNVVFYVDPDKIIDVKNLISTLEVEKVENDSFTITYIVNTKATLIPTFLIRKKIKKKAKKTATISYVLDNEKVLVQNWNLLDNSANVLILNDENQILYQSSGKINAEQIDKINKIIKKNS